MTSRPLDHLRPSDIRGIARLAAQATEGVTDIVEGVHRSVWTSIGAPGGAVPGRTRGITGLVYRTVRGVTRVVASGTDFALAQLQPFIDAAEGDKGETPQREAVFAALNGVMGDRLAADGHPFAIPMTLRCRGETLSLRTGLSIPEPTGKILLLIHGLCMTDHQWRTRSADRVVDHGESLAAALGSTPIHLRYNSGLHVSENGRQLTNLLEHLTEKWPTATEELTVVAHSMGGLVIRSAIQEAKRTGLHWPDRLKSIVFLGTPHHGAPLERAGSWVDGVLAATPYTAPFAKLGRLRSAGITDLRFGHVLDDDWRGRDRFSRGPDDRAIVPLPEGVACYAVAASTAPRSSALADRLIGDGLVPLSSALGRHDDPRRCLAFPETSQLVVHRTNHLGLLSHPEITEKLVGWLAEDRSHRGERPTAVPSQSGKKSSELP
ncbi:MAG: alpha/beta hydrolase [Candidatus Sulfomarinibacteraceae bacterium]